MMETANRRPETLLALEVLFRAPSAIRHYWRNAADEHGVFSTKQELQALLDNVGSQPDWDWIVCNTDISGDRWTQACGNSKAGLVVEINGPSRVVSHGARPWPRQNVGTGTWPYISSVAELHGVAEAVKIQFEWLTQATIAAGLDLTAPDLTVPRHW